MDETDEYYDGRGTFGSADLMDIPDFISGIPGSRGDDEDDLPPQRVRPPPNRRQPPQRGIRSAAREKAAAAAGKVGTGTAEFLPNEEQQDPLAPRTSSRNHGDDGDAKGAMAPLVTPERMKQNKRYYDSPEDAERHDNNYESGDEDIESLKHNDHPHDYHPHHELPSPDGYKAQVGYKAKRKTFSVNQFVYGRTKERKKRGHILLFYNVRFYGLYVILPLAILSFVVWSIVHMADKRHHQHDDIPQPQSVQDNGETLASQPMQDLTLGAGPGPMDAYHESWEPGENLDPVIYTDNDTASDNADTAAAGAADTPPDDSSATTDYNDTGDAINYDTTDSSTTTTEGEGQPDTTPVDTGDSTEDGSSSEQQPATTTTTTRRFELLAKLEEWGFTTHEAVTLDTSPQYMAAVWLADYDPMALPFTSADEDPVNALNLRQRYALATLYFATHGEGWLYTMSWISGKNVCEWNADFKQTEYDTILTLGVDCSCAYVDAPEEVDCDPAVVKAIVLDNVGLRGTIPPEIQLLSASLQVLSLHQNALDGTVPEEITKLTRLTYLDVHSNRLSGPIPATIGNLAALQTLIVADNKLTGIFPDTITNLNSLTVFNGNQNQFSGDLQPLAGLPALQALFLEQNQLQGSLSSDVLASWPAIQVLDVSENQLTGDLPSNLFSLPEMMVLDLHQNKFHGNLPEAPSPDSSFESKLLMVTLNDNELTGSLPESMSALRLVERLDLSMTQVTGVIPDAWSSLQSLTYLSLSFNDQLADAPIPAWIGSSLPNLKTLFLQESHRTGRIPTELGLLQSLELLDLSHNQLTGPLPAELAHCNNLTMVILNHNYLEGEIPEQFVELDVTTLLLQNNQIHGSAGILCQPQLPRLTTFYSDCTPYWDDQSNTNMRQLECTCCTKCCDQESQDDCDDMNGNLYGASGLAWDNPYVVDTFHFHDSITFSPLDYNAATATGTYPTEEDFQYDTTGTDNTGSGVQV